jgi:polyisoprenoid-binding protein YceI
MQRDLCQISEATTMLSPIRIFGFLLALIFLAACGTSATSTPRPTPTLTPTPVPEITLFIVDNSQSIINYTAIGALNMHFPGTFNTESSTVEFVPEAGGYRVKIDILINGNSVTAVNGVIRDALKSSLETDKYPQAHLTGLSKEIVSAPSGTLNITVTGTLELHGQTHTVDLPLNITISNGKLQGGGELEIDLLNYGVNVPTAIMSSKVIFKASVVALAAESTTF